METRSKTETLEELIGIDNIKKGINDNCRSINCMKFMNFPGGIGSDNDIGIRQLDEYLEEGAAIIDVYGGCCDGAIGYEELLNPFLENLKSIKSPKEVYMFCDPSCSEPLNVMAEDYLLPFIKKKGDYGMPSIILGSYLSRHSGWDCGSERDLVKNFSNLKFEDSTLIRGNCDISIAYKKNKSDTDLEIFNKLLKSS
jgi:hypothetical protein